MGRRGERGGVGGKRGKEERDKRTGRKRRAVSQAMHAASMEPPGRRKEVHPAITMYPGSHQK